MMSTEQWSDEADITKVCRSSWKRNEFWEFHHSSPQLVPQLQHSKQQQYIQLIIMTAFFILLSTVKIPGFKQKKNKK